MRYDAGIHRRRSIRLRGYDYSRCGYYFITVCVQGRRCLFGEIENGKMVLNDAGKMVGRWWNELKNKYGNIEIDEYVVMPNHFHGVIKILDEGEGKGDKGRGEYADSPVREGASPGGFVQCEGGNSNEDKSGDGGKGDKGRGDGERGDKERGEYVDSPLRPLRDMPLRALYRMVQWFKVMTTNEYIRSVKEKGWERFGGRLWQRNYYEHIVRNEMSLQRIREYIVNNACKWQEDKLFKG